MKVLLTGASGFLGSHLVRHLIDAGFTVRILCRPTSNLDDLETLEIEKAFGDINDTESLVKACQGCDGVFHLAGYIGYSKNQRPLMDKVNVEGTRQLLEAMKKAGVKKMVHFSSVVTVGALFKPGTGLTEESAYNVGHLNLSYFETKRAAEILVMEAVKNSDLHAVIVNPSTVYGPGDAKKGSRGTQLKVAQGRFPVYTDGGVSIAHVDDICEGAIAAWNKGHSGRRYILSGENITIKTLFEMIAKFAGKEPPKHKLPKIILKIVGWIGDYLEYRGRKGLPTSENVSTATMYHWYECTRAKQELGYKTRPASACIEESVLWMKKHKLI